MTNLGPPQSPNDGLDERQKRQLIRVGVLVVVALLLVTFIFRNTRDVKVSFVSYTDSVSQMQDGHAQAFMLGTTIPAGSVMDLASARDVKLLDLAGSLEAMRKLNPGYTLVNVPGGTYPKQTGDVKVIGYAMVIEGLAVAIALLIGYLCGWVPLPPG